MRPPTSTDPVDTAHGDPDLAAVGRMLAEPARARILLALDDGRALPASRLADEAGIAASTASGHLGRLVAGGLLSVETHGRHRYYRLAGPEVGRLIEAVGALAPSTPVRSLRDGTRAAALRRGRTCYDHLAGRIGVRLMGAFLERGWVEGGDGSYDPADARVGAGHEVDYRITASGAGFLEGFGVRLPPRRIAVRYCVDWTEQRHHLAGGLGRGLLDAFVERDWVRRSRGTRAVAITPAGRAGLAGSLGVELDPMVSSAG